MSGGGCVQRIEVILKMAKKSRGGGQGGRGCMVGGGGVRVDVY